MSSFESRGKARLRNIHLASFSLALFFALGIFSLSTAANAATLYISPSTGQYTVGQKFTENVMVDSGGQSINAVSGSISFYPSTAKVVSISENSSIVNFWATQPTFSNVDGTIDFEGVVLSPGFSGPAGDIITITFLSEAPGQNPLSFSVGSVLANDGNGTNILSGMNGATISIVSSAAPAASSLTPSAPGVSSETNPSPDGWGATSSPSFSWPVSSDIMAVRLLYDKNPLSAPTVLYSSPISTKTLSALSDGVYYFHVQLQNQYGWGAVTHYKFGIDTVPSDPFTISFPNGATSSTSVETVAFKATDALSGIDHYSLQIDNQTPFTVSPSDIDPSYSLPSQTAGNHALIVTAFDMAGNSTVATANFTVAAAAVAPATTATSTSWNFFGQDTLLQIGEFIINYLSLALIAVVVLALLIGLFLRIIKRVSTLKKRVRKEVSQAEDILHRSFDLLKEDVNEHIRLLLKAETKRALTKEEEIFLKKFGSNLTEAERIIANEIRSLDDLK